VTAVHLLLIGWIVVVPTTIVTAVAFYSRGLGLRAQEARE